MNRHIAGGHPPTAGGKWPNLRSNAFCIRAHVPFRISVYRDMPTCTGTQIPKYCLFASTICRQCLQFAGCIYLWWVRSGYTIYLGKRECARCLQTIQWFQYTQCIRIYTSSLYRHGARIRVFVYARIHAYKNACIRLYAAHLSRIRGVYAYISLGHPLGANTEQIRTFSGFSQFFVQCTKISSVGGGMCILFEICEKRPFQKCMGKGGDR